MINVQLKNSTQPLTDGTFDSVQLNQADQYSTERLACDKLRISANVGVICDGTLFNPTTEIVSDPSIIKFGPINYGDSKWFTNDGIQNIRFGLDVFNCEFLRKKYPTLMTNDNFNETDSYNYSSADTTTIKVGGTNISAIEMVLGIIGQTISSVFSGEDPINRDVDTGNTVTGYEKTGVPCKYNDNNYFSYYGAVKNKLVRNNGYFGFYNPIFLKSWSVFSSDHGDVYYSDTGWEENISDGYGHVSGARAGEFIEMYPGSKEYSYVPTYNKEKSRTEYNWLTFLTYPSENILLDEYMTEYGSLKVTFVDDTDTETITFHTPLKNGLSVGDVVNIYSDLSGIITVKFSNVEVISVDNAYDFTILSTEKLFDWEYKENEKQSVFSDTDEIVKRYKKSGNNHEVVMSHAGADTDNILMEHGTYSRTVNNTEDPIFSIKKVENSMECEYYFRKFKSLPVTPSVMRNSFARDTFGVYRVNVLIDDVDIKGLNNNLGCPVTDLYLTTVKNNKGYSKWYGYYGEDPQPNNNEVEASHCFGPVNGGFVTNAYGRKFDDFDVRYTGRDNGVSVLSENSEVNEVSGNTYEGIGDFCIFSPSIFKETPLQSFMHRFNTAQRDEIGDDKTSSDIALYVTSLSYKVSYGPSDNAKPRYFNILSESGGVKTEKISVLDNQYSDVMTNGYYYQPHHKIMVRTYENELSYRSAVNYKVVSITSAITDTYTYGGITSSPTVWKVTTDTPNDFRLNGEAYLYFVMPDTTYKQPEPFIGVVRWRYTDTEVSFEINDESKKAELDELIEMCNSSGDTPAVYVCHRDELTPLYARFINDGTLRYVWRNVMQNGFDDSGSYETYPFTNGALYIEPTINVYLRRQRPTKSDLANGGSTIEDVLAYPSSETMGTITNKPSSYETVLDQKELETC